LKYNANGLIFDFMHYFHMKMSLFGLCTLFSKVTLFSLPEVFCWPRIYQKWLAAGGPPRTPLGEHTTIPRLPSRLRRGTPPPQYPPHRRVRRSASVAPNVKSWLRPWVNPKFRTVCDRS